MDEMTDDEFQFYKEKLQTLVKQYLELDDEIIALKKATKDRNNKKKELSTEILENMKTMEIDHMNVKNAKLVHKVSNCQKGINKQTLLSGLNNIFEGNDEAITNALDTILQSRENYTKESLKLVRPRLKKS